jgi:hypothetical protein
MSNLTIFNFYTTVNLTHNFINIKQVYFISDVTDAAIASITRTADRVQGTLARLQAASGRDIDSMALVVGSHFSPTRRGGVEREVVRRRVARRGRPTTTFPFKFTCLDGPQRTNTTNLPHAQLKSIGAGMLI